MTCDRCAELEAQLTETRRYLDNSRRRSKDLRRRLDYLFADWTNRCVEAERLRAEIRQLRGES